MDHLFLDQDGIPTIVEVKRQSDTRIRREVVGQMLDYAANGVAYWPVEEIKSLFEANCNASNVDPSDKLAELIGPDASADDFWGRVKTNLQAGKVRMIFVADLIPPELRKIVEFLNKQMDPAEVLALELRQFEGDGGLKTLVPQLYGRTEEAQQRKAISGERRVWDETSIYEELNRLFGPDDVEAAKKIASWMKNNADRYWFGSGKVIGSIGTTFVWNGASLYPLNIYANGRVSVNFGYCMKGPFESAEKRLEWIRRLNQIEGVNLPERPGDRPSLLLSLFKDQVRLKRFFEVMNWWVSELRKPPNPS